ncbi:MAG: protease modulator HflC [Acidobacteria bacterium]|nr:MAG: protease modulator HflC [Acidobacteriota bacterium]REK11800.1 MAG: protease modulator HflC [Acidobacteriota bacterium]
MRALTLLLVAAVLLVVASSAFIVREDQQVIITQFGEPQGDPIVTPGIKFKLPFIQKAQVFDKRFLEWQGDAEELTTKDKVFIFVDVYARWRIADPLLFFQRLKDERGAQSRLDDILDGETRNAIARHNLLEVIRTSNRQPAADESNPEGDSFEEIQRGRDAIRAEILASSQPSATALGIEILDVRFRRINYSEKVEPSVFNRMISERQRIADRFRSEGQGEAARILGEMERELKRIQSEAYREAETIRGRADSEATSIYASAYDQSADSRSFYEFLKSMSTLEQTVDPDTLLMLSTDGDFYRYLESSRP